MLQEVTNKTDRDPRCCYCGRPIVNTSLIEDSSYIVHGHEGPYHPECTHPPDPPVPFANIGPVTSDLFIPVGWTNK